MKAIKLRIDTTGAIRGLWTDAVDWASLGRLAVRRASHVEFCPRKQQWYVQASRPRSALHRIFQAFTGRRLGDILHHAATREEALAWEHDYFSAGSEGTFTTQPRTRD